LFDRDVHFVGTRYYALGLEGCTGRLQVGGVHVEQRHPRPVVTEPFREGTTDPAPTTGNHYCLSAHFHILRNLLNCRACNDPRPAPEMDTERPYPSPRKPNPTQVPHL